MADQIPPIRSVSRQRATSLLALALVLGVFGLVVLIVSHRLRADMRERVLEREASVLAPLVQYQIDTIYSRDSEDVLGYEMDLMVALLETSNIEGALGVQLFDRFGENLFSVPEEVEILSIDASVLGRLYSQEAVATFYENAREEFRFELLLLDDDGGVSLPVLELFIPLSHESEHSLVGVARYVFDGTKTRKVLSGIDSDVTRLGLVAFTFGSVLISIIFLVAVARLRGAYESLDAQAKRLKQANIELDSVARTAAIGAVASHLIHGLRNPLAGLRQYVEASDIELDDEDRKDAQEAGQRMQALISEVVDVIRGDESGESISIDLEDIKSDLMRKHSGTAQKKDIIFSVRSEGVASLDSRYANIALLITSNLIQNAIDASPRKGRVTVDVVSVAGKVDVSVEDTGGGFSESARLNLFSPVQSIKSEGAGIGLAISFQLARHIGSELELVNTGPGGSLVRLSIPEKEESYKLDTVN
tara:strand:- start:1754 stop:3181 length:1428 start_codon:yes stop_codon:yes gene_type:complete